MLSVGHVLPNICANKSLKSSAFLGKIRLNSNRIVTKAIVNAGKLKIPASVKEAEKEPENLTMTAEATGVREIKATFNKAIGSDSKITLKKGTSDVEMKALVAEDGMSATITLTGKLSAGTYTVTVVAGDETVTADVVTKDEALTSFEIGSTLKEVSKANDKAKAEISYKALNQYGEKLNYQAALNSVTVSIGKVTEVKPCKASQSGTIIVEDIPAMYAIPGQSFTFVLVDTVNNTGITLNTTAVYGASATASEFTPAGVYNATKSVFKDVADGNKISDFELLFTCKDQYGDDMDSKDVAKLASNGAVQVTIAGGLTNIKANDSYKDNTLTANIREIDDVTYFVVPFTNSSDTDNTANAGNYTVNIVNSTKGIVYTGEYTVTSGTVFASIQISPKDTIYADQDNEFDYTVTDTEGKEVTDYATLKDIKIEGNATGEKNAFTWKKNTNGTAKLVYKPAKFAGVDSTRPYKNSEIRSCTITANKAISGKLLVQSQTFTVYYQRNPLAVSGLASTATTVTTDGNLELKLEDLIILDQYQNPYSADALKGNNTIAADVYVSAKDATNAAITAGGVPITALDTPTAFGTKVAISSLSGTQKLNFVVSNAAVVATKTTGNDYTATFKSGDAESVSGLYVASVNGGCALQADGVNDFAWLVPGGAAHKDSSAPSTNAGYIIVKGKVNGKDVIIEPSQYSIVGAEQSGWLKLAGVQSFALASKVLTETREFSVVVRTADGPQTITGKVDISNEPVTAKKISAKGNVATSYDIASGSSFTYASADALFTVKTQYNTVVSSCELVTYGVESAVVSGTAVRFDNKTYNDGDAIPVAAIAASLDGSNKNDLKVKNGVASDGLGTIIATVSVEGKVDKTDSVATKKITINFGY